MKTLIILTLSAMISFFAGQAMAACPRNTNKNQCTKSKEVCATKRVAASLNMSVATKTVVPAANKSKKVQ